MNHLPECPVSSEPPPKRNADLWEAGACICDRLRACEQRSYTLGIEVGKHDGWIAGQSAGVQAARDAVAGVTRYQDEGINGVEKNEDGWAIDRDEALAAIDALRQP